MGNSGDWGSDSEGEVHDMVAVDLVIVDQRTTALASTMRKLLMSKKLQFEEAQTVQSTDGQHLILQWKTHSVIVMSITTKSVKTGLTVILCVAYIAIIVGLALGAEDGSFSDPFVLEIKYKSLSAT